MRFDHQAYHLAGMDVERTGSDQVLVHRRVEQAEVDDIVEVAVDVVVHPTRRQRFEMCERAARLGFGSFHGVYSFIPRRLAVHSGPQHSSGYSLNGLPMAAMTGPGALRQVAVCQGKDGSTPLFAAVQQKKLAKLKDVSILRFCCSATLNADEIIRSEINPGVAPELGVLHAYS